ncbi:Mitochondrial pyruvate carrier 2 [Geodia barretti]|uniref:Mitochondrial pyruvate carrier n=1 Tax=Geodia barretti TaxID=519541 RepID=A0AA35WKU8_GEOBA|nr:Mitochondrial pyruvate carrier 2 [Geodia barretti]
MAAVARSVSRVWGRFEQRLPKTARNFLNHAAGPKTIFFWAPTFKWGLVVAGLADVTRPAEKLSLQQSGALAATDTGTAIRVNRHLHRHSPRRPSVSVCCIHF